MSKKTAPRRAYSYVRFSHPKQAEGGGLARQMAGTLAYCKRHDLILDDSLNLQDLGMSAFRSDNVREGALAGFLEACRTERVPPGSTLIVESLDRLSRDEIRPALQLFLAIQDFGITIVTLQPEREYRPDAADPLTLVEPLIIFARAHEESAMKSHRRRDGWRQARDRARAGGGPMLKTCPAWLEVGDDGAFHVRSDRAATVRQIFAMAMDGLGVGRITERLSREKVPPLGRKGSWVQPYVYKILTSPAAMGTHQPRRIDGKRYVPDGEPIPGYYPAVVTEDEWRAAQAAVEGRGNGRGAGRAGANEANLFVKLLRCAVNRGPMHLSHAMGRKPADGSPRKVYTYLTSILPTGVPDRRLSIDYHSFEDAVLNGLYELQPRDVTGEPLKADDREATRAQLTSRLMDLDDRIERTKRRALTTQDFDAYLDLIEDLRKERREVSDQLQELEPEDAGNPSSELGEAKSLIELLRKAPPEQVGEIRRRLKARIRALVSEIWVLVRGSGRGKAPRHAHVQIFLRVGGVPRPLTVFHPRRHLVEPLPEGTDLRRWGRSPARSGRRSKR